MNHIAAKKRWKHCPIIGPAQHLINALQEAGLPEPVWAIESDAVQPIVYTDNKTWLDIGALPEMMLSDLLIIFHHAQIRPDRVLLVGWDSGLRVMIRLEES